MTERCLTAEYWPRNLLANKNQKLYNSYAEPEIH